MHREEILHLVAVYIRQHWYLSGKYSPEQLSCKFFARLSHRLVSMFGGLGIKAAAAVPFRQSIRDISQRRLTSASSQQQMRGWRKYAQQFRDKPASYMTSFAILHEVTAIVPLPLVYYALDYSEVRVPVPEQAVAEGNRIMSKIRTRYGFEPLPADSRVMVNLATSYAVVKVISGQRTSAIIPFFGTKLRFLYHLQRC